MSMDPWFVIQIVIGLIFASASKKGTAGVGLVFLLLASWVTPIFFLGLFKAILIWVMAMFIIGLVLTVQEKFA